MSQFNDRDKAYKKTDNLEPNSGQSLCSPASVKVEDVGGERHRRSMSLSRLGLHGQRSLSRLEHPAAETWCDT